MLNNSAVDRVFQALGDPTRRAIVERLSRGSATVSDLARLLDITLAAVVQHLQVLEDSGVVRTEKLGRVRCCHIRPDGLAYAERWISERRGTPWDRPLDRFSEGRPGATVAVSAPRRKDRT
jgi:DNA-binding transcriptional ArsR family regulator